MRCAVASCPHNSNTKIPGVSYHTFPKDLDLKQKWLEAIERIDYNVTSCSVICSRHFEEKDINRKLSTVRLRENALPCLRIKVRNDDNICNPCYILMNSPEARVTRLYGHTMVCIGCGGSLRYSADTHLIENDSPLLPYLSIIQHTLIQKKTSENDPLQENSNGNECDNEDDNSETEHIVCKTKPKSATYYEARINRLKKKNHSMRMKIRAMAQKIRRQKEKINHLELMSNIVHNR